MWNIERRHMIDIIPLVLGLVCKRWRSITLETPILWTYIRLSGNAVRKARYIPSINRWLARSKTLPCEVATSLWVGKGDHVPIIMPHILGPITPRIEVLKLKLEFDELQECLKLIPRGFPLLKTLDLSLSRDVLDLDNLSSLPTLSFDFSTCPRVESITVSEDIAFELPIDDALVDALPPSIKHFQQDFSLQPSKILESLSRCRGLEEFHLCDPDDTFGWAEPLPEDMEYRFSHTSMRILGLRFLDGGIAPLFRAIKFPALQDLCLSGFAEPEGVLG
ncbi:hypothetical protein AX16_001120 [Volvariella volvacea WC 439]|nr:hypothetical protein AX16_001120 [Volvariella volvacea WC 439]